MENLITYFSFIALILVVILMIWSLILTRRERAKKVTAKSRLARLRNKIEALPEDTDEERSKKERLGNIETMLSEREIELPDECIDVIWMCDVLHEITERRAVLEELHRVLRNEGVLAIYDGMREKALGYTTDLFSLTERDDKFFRFAKIS